MKTKGKRKRIAFFMLASLMIFLLAEGGMFFLYGRNERSAEEAYKQNAVETTESLTELFGSAFNAAARGANVIFSQRWYNVLRASGNP